MIATTTIHSTGINWGQALATWIPIVLSLAAATIATVRSVQKWQRTRALRAENLVTGLIQSFASTLNVRFEQIEDKIGEIDEHLKRQDQETTKRFDRVDRNTHTDSS